MDILFWINGEVENEARINKLVPERMDKRLVNGPTWNMPGTLMLRMDIKHKVILIGIDTINLFR